MGFDVETRIRNVTAVLGPTNTGKTHLAIERMLGHETGMIGLPLRLLAREVYDRIAARIGADKVALITGEEKIRPESARYWVCTVEAMPREIDVDFLAIDEIQLAADPERGHVFTDRLLHARGKLETLLLGAGTMRDTIADLVPHANFITRPRLSKLSYTGQKKITRLPSRTAIVAFSSSEVYAIAELIRRQQGGAAVVMGALSPRTRNAQVALYQSGDVDFLVATDAIGMGLNLDVNHVSFAATRKFDGHNHRQLTPAEMAQIAGRAGRHMNDGTFGITGDVEPFDQDIVERLESHTFDPVKVLQWRARNLDFSSVDALQDSLKQIPREQRLVRARTADDLAALEAVTRESEITDYARGTAAVSRLWDVCQIPDYRKISPQNHSELVSTVYKYLMSSEGRIPEDWFAKQVEFSDRTDGDIDTLATRIAHIRTWTFVANRQNWLKDHAQWQGRTREIEDALSDALHEQLTQRFVDRRTSALMKGLRAKEELNADIGDDGAIHVESHYVGRLKGFRFIPDSQADSVNGKAARHAAAQVLAKELAMRVRRVSSAKPDAFKLTRAGRIMWRDQEIGKLEASEDGLKPQIVVLCDEHLTAADKEKVQERLNLWITEIVTERLAPLVEIAKAEDVTGLAKGIAFRMVENFGSLQREAAAEEIKSLDQTSRSQLRKYGARFGAFNLYFPQVLKPAAAELILVLWSLKHAAANGLDPDALPEPPRAGLTSVPANAQIPDAFYRACGYHVCGPRAVRMDMLERLADLIRPLIAWRKPDGMATATPPKGSTGDGAFVVTPEMLSILGCSSDEMGLVLKTLGFRGERRPKRKPDVVKPVAAVATAITATTDSAAESGSGAAEPPAEPSQPLVGTSEAEPVISPVEDADGRAAEMPVAAQSMISDEAASVAGVEAASTPPLAEAETVEAVATSDMPISAASAEPVAAAPEPAAAQAQPDTQPDTSTDASAKPASVEPEVEFEEIWRPRRRREHQQPRADDRRRPRPGQSRGDQSRGDRDRPVRPATGPATAVADGSTPQAASGDAAKRGDGRPQRTGGDRSRHQSGGYQGGGRRDDRPNRSAGDAAGTSAGGSSATSPAGPSGNTSGPGGRPRDRRDDRPAQAHGGHHRGPHQGPRADQLRPSGPRPPNKPKVADPDSPFAKLSALKAELEKRAQEQSS